MAVLGLIGSRQGSKRLPGKAMLDLGGIPLIQHTVQRAVLLLDRDVLDACVVSSDDDEVLNLAAKAGLWCHPRDPALAADDTPDRAWVAAAMQLPLKEGSWDTLCLMRPTSPFLEASTIGDMLERFKVRHRGRVPHSVVTMTPTAPLEKMWVLNGGIGFPPAYEYVDDHDHEMPSQGFDPCYRQTGGCDVLRVKNLPKTLRGDNIVGHVISWPESCDINKAVDLEMARAWLSYGPVQRQMRIDKNGPPPSADEVRGILK